ncbi:hypothetical protein HNE_0814 [Hyphomonas neptunium ATCC 15444]|uniref:Uncharacterized protein n=2 Tax=Hyphomonas TaxID=85 RepID=Q0C402_HYPNA|nr:MULTISPECIES: hypothetical protein [Hyphomonas]ABI78352.1 hypothetical protein HNE_0814 [Hyphomonas neptunium ATCC 15444]KCZ96246.1 hypothetical protein HHI_01165 [Hyphomonas hirschiana VP5]
MTTETLRADEAIAVRLMQAIRADAEIQCAPDALDLVSVTLDLSATADTPEALVYKPRIDRKTRTILFTSGSADGSKGAVMTATVVYRIRPAD